MTISDVSPRTGTPRDRTASTRHYVMCPPTHFAVEYAINPWMDTGSAVDSERAVAQWDELVRIYRRLGHTVSVLDPIAGLPDMVYAANGGLVIGDRAIVARFRYAERTGEARAHAAWMAAADLAPVRTRHVNEGQSDLLIAGPNILAGTGFRTDRRVHAEIAALTGRPVVTLELVDPRFYHLDTALAVLDHSTIAYYPPAFTEASRARLAALFPDAIEVASADAYVLGLNAVSDGHHVVHPAAATGFAAQLRASGFDPIGADLSELLKGGGSVKCCTLEVHP